ncbi:stealth conserved region 3 domain-containing protein [Acidisoma sp. L85]|uniref:stealth conserved region 3 domain-containing protein n=1 Tax=Acidisoma sp. L85 TaxID=1641850 RepID=UPI00131C3B96|nr:stealth conserved region 3 domain-containing protein [Acidisoma sp. L85]
MIIDAVVLWVKLDDDLARSLAKWQEAAGPRSNLLASRYRDNEELSFSVPAIRKFLPWVRKIFIVTNGQSPPEAVLGVPGVEVIYHEQFYCSRHHLPTFNSNSIESNVCFIDGLSEQFIMFNDDFFIGRPLSKGDFFSQEGRPVFRMERHYVPDSADEDDLYAQALIGTDALLSERLEVEQRHFLTHTPFGCRRSSCFELWLNFGPQLFATSSSRFRATTNMLFAFLYAHYFLYKERSEEADRETAASSSASGSVKFLTADEYRFVPLGDGHVDWKLRLDRLILDRPAFFCLNDHIGANELEKERPVIDRFYDQYRRLLTSDPVS